jgi:hypothetical protein
MSEAEGNPLNHKLAGAEPGRYTYGDLKNTGKHVLEWYKEELGPLFKASAARSDDGAIRGDGSKL